MILVSKFDEMTADRKVVGPGSGDWGGKLWEFLEIKDRHLLELYSRGMSHRQIGEILKMNGGSVSRRIVAINARLRSPLVTCLEQSACQFEPLDLEIARRHFIGGLSISRIAQLISLPSGVVRQQLAYLTGLLEEMSRRQNRYR